MRKIDLILLVYFSLFNFCIALNYFYNINPFFAIIYIIVLILSLLIIIVFYILFKDKIISYRTEKGSKFDEVTSKQGLFLSLISAIIFIINFLMFGFNKFDAFPYFVSMGIISLFFIILGIYYFFSKKDWN